MKGSLSMCTECRLLSASNLLCCRTEFTSLLLKLVAGRLSRLRMKLRWDAHGFLCGS